VGQEQPAEEGQLGAGVRQHCPSGVVRTAAGDQTWEAGLPAAGLRSGQEGHTDEGAAQAPDAGREHRGCETAGELEEKARAAGHSGGAQPARAHNGLLVARC